MPIVKNQFKVSPPNKYHPHYYKVILVENDWYAVAKVDRVFMARESNWLITVRREMEDYIERMKCYGAQTN